MRPSIILRRAASYAADSILPVLFWVSLLFGFDTPDMAILTLIAALIHEGGHLFAIHALRALKRRDAERAENAAHVRGHLSGFRIRAPRGSYAEEITVLLAGPAMNIAFAILLLPILNAGDGYIRAFLLLNVLTAVSSLAPIEGYDGYGILKKICESKNSPRAISALSHTSFTLAVILSFFALYIMLRFGDGYWIFGVFFLILVGKIRKFLSH